jgi:transcriptional regulator with XRE-family HTH domain
MTGYDANGIGMKLRQARRNMGLTQRAVADKLNVEQSYISAIELGQKTGSAKTLARLSEFLQVPIAGLHEDPVELELPEDTPPGLVHLLSDQSLAKGLMISEDEIRVMMTLQPDQPLSKLGYLHLLTVLRGSIG